jgi:5-formyltetrahydrofolate cyclo-ligase
MDDAKKTLRKRALARRDALSRANAQAAALALAPLGCKLVERNCAPGAKIALYWPIRSELSTLPLIDALQKAGFKTLLPVMQGVKKPLLFRHYNADERLVKSALGLSEPDAQAPAAEPDFLFLPLAAFDGAGGRLGYGGGVYDATLAALRARPNAPKACGLAFAAQEVPEIPAEPHDQRLDFLLTETGLLSFGV